MSIYKKIREIFSPIQENDYTKHIKVLNERDFTSSSEISELNMWDSQPDRPFREMMDIIDHDPRLQLSRDTYVQMILGSGVQIKSEKKRLQKKIEEWFDDINFEERLEDGLHSYAGSGNLLWEIEPKTFSDFVEIPIDTIVGVKRDKRGRISKYVQEVNNKFLDLDPDTILHFRLTDTRREIWGRGIFHSVINDFVDPRTGTKYRAPIFAMKDAEDGLVKIVQNYASPVAIFHFKDAGENFIKKQADDLRKARPGAKILTDKEFDLKFLEAKGDSKFAGYIEHLQKNVVEPGSEFPLQFFNAGFTARAASETTDSVVIRKIKRIQRRLAEQLKEMFVFPYVKKAIDSSSKMTDFDIRFEFDDKTEFDINQLITLFRDNGIRRSELRKNLLKHTTIEIDQDDMDDEPPITSVTPTNEPNPEPEPIPQRDGIEEVKEPFGPFKDFNQCVNHFIDKGDSKSTAQRKCGKLQKDLEAEMEKLYKRKKRKKEDNIETAKLAILNKLLEDLED